MLENAGFSDFEFCQTLVVPDPSVVEKPISGYDKGSFVVIKAVKYNDNFYRPSPEQAIKLIKLLLS